MEFKLTAGKSDRIRADFSEIEFQEICSLTPFISDNSRKSSRVRVFCLLNNITEVPTCPECEQYCHFLRSGKFSTFCSMKCRANSILTKEKIKATTFRLLGVYHNFQSPTVKEQIKNTNFERYGVQFPMQSLIIQQTAKETSFKKYGTYSASSLKYVKDKISISSTNHYQARRNEEGTDYSGVVYILHFPQHQAVKIGLTGDFDSRAKGLISDFGEFSVIDIIETEECFKLESSLHEKFSEYRICLEEGGGRTEFFKERILNILKEA
jgi:hypothetical protein